MGDADRHYITREGAKKLQKELATLRSKQRPVIVQEVAEVKYTTLGWEVPDVAAAARDLRQAGVELERYEGLGQDELGIVVGMLQRDAAGTRFDSGELGAGWEFLLGASHGGQGEDRGNGEKAERSERYIGTFRRSIALPTRVDANKVSATYRDGILTVTLPKAEEVKPKQIQVS